MVKRWAIKTGKDSYVILEGTIKKEMRDHFKQICGLKGVKLVLVEIKEVKQ